MTLGNPLVARQSAQITPTRLLTSGDKDWVSGLVTRYLAEPEASAMLRILAMAQRVSSVVLATTIGDALSVVVRLAIVVTPLVWLFTAKQ